MQNANIAESSDGSFLQYYHAATTVTTCLKPQAMCIFNFIFFSEAL